MRNYIFVLYLLLILTESSCKPKVIENSEVLENKLNNQKAFLNGKKLKSIRQIMTDSIDLTGHFLFLYNGFDCETCLVNGFKLAESLDSLANEQVVYVVSTSSNIGADQLRYNYLNYIFNDEHDIIRSELKYIYTPVFLFFDSSDRIEEVYYPSYTWNINDENLFINKCFKSNK